MRDAVASKLFVSEGGYGTSRYRSRRPCPCVEIADSVPPRSDQNVGKSIVVVILNRDAHPVHLHSESGLAHHIREGSVAVVAIQAQRGVPLLVTKPVHTMDQQDVGPAIAVVIEERTARSQSLGRQQVTIEPLPGRGRQAKNSRGGADALVRARPPGRAFPFIVGGCGCVELRRESLADGPARTQQPDSDGSLRPAVCGCNFLNLVAFQIMAMQNHAIVFLASF